MKQLRWRKTPREKGLAGIAAASYPRGCQLFYGAGNRVATVSYAVPYQAWFWSGGCEELGVKIHNTLWDDVKFATLEEAKTHCMNHFRTALKQLKANTEQENRHARTSE